MSIESFIAQLSKVRNTSLYDNIYAGKSQQAALRRNNLQKYLEALQKRQVKVLLVGEAPGYKGCALTGIPFTDEATCFSLNEQKYRDVYRYNPDENPELFWEIAGEQKEASAQTMWEVFRRYNYVPLMWNAFPFHPHLAGDKKSNRTPTPAEIKKYGQKFIKLLMAEFPEIESVYAVGKKAQDLLSKMGIEADYIRHPSHGGKSECQQSLSRALGEYALPFKYLSQLKQINPDQIFAIDEEGIDLYYEHSDSAYVYSIYLLRDKSIAQFGIYRDEQWEQIEKHLDFTRYMEFRHPNQLRQILYMNKDIPIRVVGADVLRCDGFLVGEQQYYVPNTDTYQLRDFKLN